MDEYLTPSGSSEAEFTEKRSRFIGNIWQTETEDEAVACIKAMRERHWDAKHNVYAYIIRDGATRYSDDGEPQGTAGMPVLDVLQREKLFNVTCVVTRYFGGILLGTGGLVRAYTKAAKMAVDGAGISIKRVWDRLLLDCPYCLYEQVKLLVLNCEGMVEDTAFGANVMLTLLLPQANTEHFEDKLTDLTGGQLTCKAAGQEYRAFPVKCS